MIGHSAEESTSFAALIKPDGSKRQMNFRFAALTTLALVTSFSAPVHADPREDLLQAIGKCRAVTDDKARLACYDAAAPHVRDVLNVPPPVLSAPPTPEEQKSWFGFNLDNLFGLSAPSQQTTPQQFGADRTPQAQQAAPQEVDSISAGVTEYSFTFDKKFIVFLDNGQVWRQVQGDTALAHFHNQAADNKVTIERGVMGSYNLTINDSEATFKVTRLK
jgi:hypothetical protein